ncbi:penicillin-binding protein 1C [Bdellovibrio sp.]|uniref:penicillin-binding protein 1C n=1 Tax=Bdellovibrio sp. TaxID=28201 RepID=UPI003221898E
MKKKVAAGIIAGTCVLGLAGGLGYYAVTSPSVPDFSKVESSYKSSDLFLVDRKGQPLQQWRQDLSKRSFLWVKYKDISPDVISAVLLSEDKNFQQHHGVDWKALVASAYQRNFKDSSRGGSTVSMQLLKLLHPRKELWQGFSGKLRQVVAVTALERHWSKEQILEAYLNLVGFRGEARGLSAAVWNMYGQTPRDVSRLDATLLAVLIRSPNADAKQWEKRACWQAPDLCSAFESRIRHANNLKMSTSNEALHLAQRISREGQRGLIQTTLDRDLQNYIQEQITGQIRRLKEQNVNDAAVLVVENATGEVWAYVGGSGALSSAPYVDGVQALRQAGSTLKPFLYATAFEKNLLHADSWIEDSAVDIVFDRGVYKPQNHDRQFYGWVMAKTALGSSLNVPAVKVFKLLNDDSFWNKLKSLNFKNLEDPEHYGPALALGVADVTLEDLTLAYRSLARDGYFGPMKWQPQETLPSSQSVFTVESAKEVRMILTENQNRALGFGLDSALALSGAAVKTGTSKDMRDNWCVGMNDRFTVGVWVGNFGGEPMWNVMGVTGAAPIWKKTMMWLQEHYPSDEVTLAENEKKESSKPQAYPGARILFPQDGMILALDPAIPAANQKMPLLVENIQHRDLYWQINEKEKIKATDSYLWSPSLGRHRFSLYEGEKKLGEVSVLVK